MVGPVSASAPVRKSDLAIAALHLQPVELESFGRGSLGVDDENGLGERRARGRTGAGYAVVGVVLTALLARLPGLGFHQVRSMQQIRYVGLGRKGPRILFGSAEES